MLRAMFTAVAGLTAHGQWLDAISNNVANMNTVGFKTYKTTFADALCQTLWSSSAPSASTLGKIGAQIGLGVKVGSLYPLFTQGALQTTGRLTDLAIEGDGFFIVKDYITGTSYYTRAGNFVTDADNYLVTPDGLRVQGASSLPSATLSDLQIQSSDPLNPMRSYSISGSGVITVLRQDGTTENIGQIALERFSSPYALEKRGNNLYVSTPAAGAQGSPYQPPSTMGLGTIRPGFIEMSNVDLGQEFSNMILSQRGFQANARAISTSDEMLQETVNIKR